MSLASAAVAWALLGAHRAAGIISLVDTAEQPSNASNLGRLEWPKWPQLPQQQPQQQKQPQWSLWPQQHAPQQQHVAPQHVAPQHVAPQHVATQHVATQQRATAPQQHTTAPQQQQHAAPQHPVAPRVVARQPGSNASLSSSASHGVANATNGTNASRPRVYAAPKPPPRLRWGICTENDDVNFAIMSKRICEINWMLHPNMSLRPPTWLETKYVGNCWVLREYNTDFHQSTGVYTNVADRRCVLAVSGFHGTLVGLQTAMAELLSPPERWKTCNSYMYAPFIRTWRHHTSLSNWSKIATYLSSNCESVTITGESLGGSSAEILASCSASHQLWQLQPAMVPHFHVHAIHTFGAMASATVPLRNTSGANLCFHGKRWFHTRDTIAKLGASFSLVHPLMDAIEVFDTTPLGSFKFRNYKCRSPASIRDNMTDDLAATFTSLWGHQTPQWAIAHEITSYLRALRYRRAQVLQGVQFIEKSPSGVDYVDVLNGSMKFDWAYALRTASSEF